MTEDFRIGLALGGGGASALSYVGVLEELLAAGVRFHCVAGTSAGAIVGAALAAGRLEEFRDVMTSLTRGRVFSLFDPVWGRGGLFGGRRGMGMLSDILTGQIEDLPMRFAAVATDLDTGEEVVLDRGSIADAVRASLAIPGVFCPHTVDGRVLVDGGLVDPIPVGVAREMGADFVIAVSILRLRGVIEGGAETSMSAQELGPNGNGNGNEDDNENGGPVPTELDAAAAHTRSTLGVLDVLAKGSAVVQSHIAAARLRDSPPDVFLSPRSEHIGVFELMRCAEAIEIGRDTAQRSVATLLDVIETARRYHGSRLRRLFSPGLARPRAI